MSKTSKTSSLFSEVRTPLYNKVVKFSKKNKVTKRQVIEAALEEFFKTSKSMEVVVKETK